MMLAIGILTAGDAMAIEKLAYRTIERDGQFEMRLIEPHVVAETFVEGDFERVGNEGFRRLVSYIGGANRSQARISMTAPVVQEPASEKISMTAPVAQEKRRRHPLLRLLESLTLRRPRAKTARVDRPTRPRAHQRARMGALRPALHALVPSPQRGGDRGARARDCHGSRGAGARSRRHDW
jgi:hypothetical protein